MDGHSRDPTYLYGGSLLAAATETAARIGADPARHPPLSRPNRISWASGRGHRRRVRLRQGLIALLTSMVVGLALAAALGLLPAGRSRQEAVRQRDLAVSDELASGSEPLGDTDPRCPSY